MFKILRLAAFCVLIQIFGSSSIFAQQYSHEADPVGKLKEFAIFATDTIVFGGSGGVTNLGGGFWFPEQGYCGTNGHFLMGEIPYNVGTVTFFDNVYAGLELELSSKKYTQYMHVFHDTVFVPGILKTHSNVKDEATVVFETNVSLDEFKPVENSIDWYDRFPKEKIVVASDAPSMINTKGNIPDGEYNEVKIPSVGMVFGKGNYYLNSLDIAGNLVIDKTPDEYCRIFVKEELTFSNTTTSGRSIRTITNIKSDSIANAQAKEILEASPGMDEDSLFQELRKKLPSDLGKVLLYTTDDYVRTNPASDEKYAPKFEASIVAPRAHIFFDDFPVISGQVLARALMFQGDFDARSGEFVPWVSANVSIKTTEIREDTDFDEINLDTTRIDRSKEYEIEVELAQGLDVPKATISYAITYLGGKDDPSAADFKNSYSADTLVKGRLEFLEGQVSPTNNIVVTPVDDLEPESKQQVLLTLYYQTGDNSDKIVLKQDGDNSKQTQLIQLIDDDPKYQTPSTISASTALSAYENQEAGFELLASFDVKDSDGDNNHTVTIVDGTGKDKFTVVELKEKAGYELRTAVKFDYEEEARSYIIKLRAQDNNGITEDFLESGMITVNILPVNDSLSVAVVDSFTVSKGKSIDIFFADLILNDTDSDEETEKNVLFVSGYDEVSGATQGTVTADIVNGYRYKAPSANGITIDSFYYKLSDSVTYKPQYADSIGTIINNDASIGKIIIRITENYDAKPEANNGSITVEERLGSAASLDLIGNLVSDDDLGGGDALTLFYNEPAFGEVSPASGTVIDGNSKISYTYNAHDTIENRVDSFKYWITDKSGNPENKATATISIVIDSLNDNVPTQEIKVDTVAYGVSEEIRVLPYKWHDYDTSDIGASIDSTIPNNGILDGPFHGTIDSVSDKSIWYTANVNDPKINTSVPYQDTIVYQILDKVDYDADTLHQVYDTLFIHFDESTKGAPKAIADVIDVLEGETVITEAGFLLLNDKKGDDNGVIGADIVGVTEFSTAQYGEVSVTDDGTVTYTHDDSEQGYDHSKEKFIDFFTYRIIDKAGKVSGEGTVTIMVEPKNDNTPVDDTVTTESVTEGSFVTYKYLTGLIDSSVTSKEGSIHSPDVKTFWSVSLKGENGGALHASSVELNTDSYELIYTHNDTDVVDFDTVTLLVRDSTNYDQNNIHEVERTVIIPIVHVNDNKPTAIDTTILVTENDTITFDVTPFLDDLDGDVLNVSVKDFSQPRANVTVVNGLFKYHRNGIGDEVFEDSFTYIVEDGVDSHTVEYTVTVNIDPRNDEAANGESDSYKMNQAEPLTVSAEDGVLYNDSDADSTTDVFDNNGNVLRVTLADTTNRGTLTLASDGSFTYLFDGADSVYADTFYYFVHDSTLYHFDSVHTSEPIMVTIDVDPTPPSVLENIVVSYFDTNSVADGLIDQILVETEVALLDTFANGMTADLFSLNSDRDFKIESIVPEGNGFSIFVTENSSGSDDYRPNTAVSGKDRLMVNSNYSLIGHLLVAKSYLINDKVAPVIIEGILDRRTKNGEQLDTLIVEFSEPVTLEAINNSSNPYNFLDVTDGREFTMSLNGNNTADSVKQKNSVVSIEIAYPVEGDSIKIENLAGNMVRDTAYNYSKNTVWAPLRVPNPYDFGLELYIYPQPLEFTLDSRGEVVADELDPSLCDVYDIPYQNGVAIVLESKGPLMESDENVAKLQIFDNTGNTVTEVEFMEFVRKTTDNSIAGIYVWDGTNIKGRSSGRSAYLIGVDVSVVTDEGENSRTVTKQFIKTIGVKQ